MKRTIWLPIFALALLLSAVACDSSSHKDGDEPAAMKKITEMEIDEMGDILRLKFTYHENGKLAKTESSLNGDSLAVIKYNWTETSMEQKFKLYDEVSISKYQIQDGRLVSGYMDDLEYYKFQYDDLNQLEQFTLEDDDNYQESIHLGWEDGKITSLYTKTKSIDEDGFEDENVSETFTLKYAQDKCFGAILPYEMIDINLPDLSIIHPEMIGINMEYPVEKVNLGGKSLVNIDNQIDSEGYITKIIMTAIGDTEQVVLTFKWK